MAEFSKFKNSVDSDSDNFEKSMPVLATMAAPLFAYTAQALGAMAGIRCNQV